MPAAVPTREVLDTLRTTQQRLERVAPRHRKRLRTIARKAVAELQARLGALPGDRSTAQQQRVILAQARLVSLQLERQMRGALATIGEAAAEIGRDGLLAQITAWQKVHPGVVQSLVEAELAGELLDAGLLEYYDTSAKRYGAQALHRMRGVMAQGALQGETLIQTSARMAQAVNIKQWQAERIVRTEHSLAMHRQQLKDLQEMMEDDPGAPEMLKELVSTFDPRTGSDSRYVHGQQRELDKPFVDDSGRRYQHPPNRPNDREVVVFVPRV